MNRDNKGEVSDESNTRRNFLRSIPVVAGVGAGVSRTATATPPTVQPDAHQTELTLTEIEGDTVNYVIDVTGNSLEAVDSKKEDNDTVEYHSGYSTCKGYLRDGTDKYTFGADDEISRIVIEDSGNLKATLSGAIDDSNGASTKVTVRGDYWGEKSQDPALSYSFKINGSIIGKDGTVEDNDERTTGSDPNTYTVSGYVAPGNKDVWFKDGQFLSFHGKPWGHELNFEIGDLPSGSPD